jgi:hypothetical protein
MTFLPALLFFVYSAGSFANYLSLPPDWEDRVIYYQSFEHKNGQPDINAADLELMETMNTRTGGIRGRCGVPEDARSVQLRGMALSPHQPLAVSFWWALQEDADKDSGFGLFHLTNGRGFVSHFARSGPWCALDRPAGVLQVYYLPDIKNVNGIYDRDLMAHVELKDGVWHHTAVVINAGSFVSLYTDGEKLFEIRITGRSFRESDQLNHVILGSSGGLPVALDEIIILNRPLLDEEIASYVQAVRQMHSVNYPLEP